MAKAELVNSKLKLLVKNKLANADVTSALAIGLIAFAAFSWRLATLTLNQLSAQELATKHQLFINSPWWKSVANINGPYYLLLHATYSINHSVWSLRLASVIIGVVASVAIYWLVSQWHGTKIGFLAGLVFIANFGILAVSREALTDISLVLITSLLLVSLALIYEYKNYWAFLALIIVAASSLYFAGSLYLVVATAALAYKPIKDTWETLSNNQKISLALLKLALVAPLIYHLIRHYSNNLLLSWFGYGLSGQPLHQLKTFGLNLLRAPLDLFFRSSKLAPTLNLGHLPLVPAAIAVIALIGGYFYVTKLTNYRWRAVITLFIISCLTTAIGVVSVYVIIPFVVIAMGTGLAFLLKEWYTVFPKNPFARYTGLIVLGLVVTLACIYSSRSYFVAWGNNPVAVSQFNHKL